MAGNDRAQRCKGTVLSTIQRFGFVVGNEARLPVVHITLMNNTRLKTGEIAITPSMTAAEIDTNIALLKADLDAVGRRAKAALDRAKKAG